jgi:hypothetical protein
VRLSEVISEPYPRDVVERKQAASVTGGAKLRDRKQLVEAAR